MAFTIFISSTGLVLNKHYCQDQLKSQALFLAAKSCQHQKMVTVPCPVHGTMEVPADEDKNCCNNESEYLKADQDLINYSFEVEQVKPLLFLAAYAYAFLESPSFDQEASINYTHYRPPIIVYDRQVHLQTFLC